MYILYLLVKSQDYIKTNATILNNNHFRFTHLDVPTLVVKKIVIEYTS